MICYKMLRNITVSVIASVTLMAADNGCAQINPSEPNAPEAPLSQSQLLEVLDFKQMDILDVLKLISQKSGVNIVAGQNVKGRITVFLKNVQVEDALKIIVDAYGWAYVKENGVIKVMTEKEFETAYGHAFGKHIETRAIQLKYGRVGDVVTMLAQVKSSNGTIMADEKSSTIILKDTEKKLEEMEDIIQKVDVPVETRIFELSYAQAKDISSKISEALTPLVGSFKQDERSNKIIVSDTKHSLSNISAMIEAFDHKEREVLIEAKIIQVVLSDEFKLGIDWEAIVSDFHDLNLKSNFDVLSSTDKSGRISVGTVANDNYAAIIEALNTVGWTEILSNPRITAMNNKEAKILVGSTEPYVTTTTTTPSSGPTTTAESINFIEVGVKLYVTPTIHKDDFITMKIKPEVSSVVNKVVTANNNSIPVVETSEAETTVMVKDGATIVIGGLIKEENIETVKQVPVLGKIPYLGAAFRSKDSSKSKTEIVIFLTPQIISGERSFD